MREKTVLITQSNYIPWKGYFDMLNSVDEFVIYDDMQFTRRDWRNRNKIKTPQGLHWLTIPVEVKGKFDQKIRETRINDPRWATQHWKTISQNYARSPYFNECKDFFEHLYNSCDCTYLSEINYRFLVAICEFLGIKISMRWSSEFDLAEERSERLLNICSSLSATRYISGPSAKEYMNENLFATHGIKVEYFDFSGYPPYHQLYGDFVHEVSVIDLIFNEGPHAKKFMKSFDRTNSTKSIKPIQLDRS